MKKNESARTLSFIVFGLLMCAAAGATHVMTQPDTSKDFEFVGQPFFESFTSAKQAKSLQVAAIDESSASLKKFSVAEKDGIWRIPSHYDYPAEAAQRLAETATSVMGISRDSLVGRLESEHERFGVLDPLDEETLDPESAGKRITLKDDSDEILVDFIVGKEAGDVEIAMEDRAMQTGTPEKYYYIRRPDEIQTYKVKLNVDISTRFGDWIDPDLLQIDKTNLRRIEVDNYKLEEQRSGPLGLGQRRVTKVQGDQMKFSRGDGIGTWELDGLQEETETLNNSDVENIASALDELKIVGVRPKFKFKGQQLVTADLEINQAKELIEDPREFNSAINRLLTELDKNGFTIYENPDPMLISTFGSVTAGLEDGIVYVMNFGKPVEGDDDTIEIGNSESDSETSEGSTEDSKAETTEAGTDDQPADDSVEEPNEAKNRFLMIRVAMDESLLGERPEKPIVPLKPVEPEGYQPPKDNAETESTNEDEGDEAPSPEEKRDESWVAYDQAKADYEQKMTEYTLALTRFEDETKAFDERIEKAKTRVKELNERFGDWYYVISADNLNALQAKRETLVTVKEPETPSETSAPNISFDIPKDEDLTAPPSMPEDVPNATPPEYDGDNSEEESTPSEKTKNGEDKPESSSESKEVLPSTTQEKEKPVEKTEGTKEDG